MNRFSQLGKTISAFSLGLFCGVAYLISCGQTPTAVSGGGAIDATAITAETLVTTGTITSGGAITAPSITLSTGAESGKFLTSNSSGEASWGSPFRTSCPAGYTLIGTAGTADTFCISTIYESPSGQSNSVRWSIAQSRCVAKTPSANLCTMNEWRRACGTNGVGAKDQMIWLLDVGCFQTDDGLNCDGAWVSSDSGGCEPQEVLNRSAYSITPASEQFYRCCFK